MSDRLLLPCLKFMWGFSIFLSSIQRGYLNMPNNMKRVNSADSDDIRIFELSGNSALHSNSVVNMKERRQMQIDPSQHSYAENYKLLTNLVVPRPIAWVT